MKLKCEEWCCMISDNGITKIIIGGKNKEMAYSWG
jgi:hypothetical protein